MLIAITHVWQDDLHPDHRQQFVDYSLTIDEAKTSRWLLPHPDTKEASHGPTLVFETSRSVDEVVQSLEEEGYHLSEFYAVNVG